MNKWHLATLLLSACVVSPLLGLFSRARFTHVFGLFDIQQILINTLTLLGGVMLLSILIAVPMAWFLGVCEVPFRRFWHALIMLPLAIPSYILAFVYIGMLDYSSPLASLFRQWGVVFPPVRSMTGLIIVMALSLYPYIYSMARNAFVSQGKEPMEIAQSLGYSKRQAFIKVLLPMALPWISQGVLLMSLEVLADFGAVSVFNITTFTTAIFTAWYGYFSLESAAALSIMLLFLAAQLFILSQRFNHIKNHFQPRYTVSQSLFSLTRLQKSMALLFIGLILSVSLLFPIAQLLVWSVSTLAKHGAWVFVPAIFKSVITSVSASIVIVLAGLLLVFTHRFSPAKWYGVLLGACRAGYAVPGSVLAVGCFQLLKYPMGITLMVFAYFVRYLSLAINPLLSSIDRIPNTVDEAARTLKSSTQRLIQDIHLPLLKPALFSAILISMIDIMKEMPIALMCRPFGWDTLAVKIYSYTEEGLWEMAGFPALLLVLVCSIPSLFYSMSYANSQGKI